MREVNRNPSKGAIQVFICLWTLLFFKTSMSSAQELQIKFENQPTLVTVPLTSTVMPSGSIKYQTTKVLDEMLEGGTILYHTISTQFIVPGNNSGAYNEMLMNGNVTVITDGATQSLREFEITVSLPTPAYYSDIVFHGQGSATLICPAGLSCSLTCSDEWNQNSEHLGALVIDNELSVKPMVCPWSLNFSGGQGKANFDFANFNYIQLGIQNSIGVSFRGVISSGAKTIFAVAPIGAQPPCKGDFSGDFKVDSADLGMLVAAWGPITYENVSWKKKYDLDNSGQSNGYVGAADLGVFLSLYGTCEYL